MDDVVELADGWSAKFITEKYAPGMFIVLVEVTNHVTSITTRFDLGKRMFIDRNGQFPEFDWEINDRITQAFMERA